MVEITFDVFRDVQGGENNLSRYAKNASTGVFTH